MKGKLHNNPLFRGPVLSWQSAPRPDGLCDKCTSWDVLPRGSNDACFRLEKHPDYCHCGLCVENEHHNFSLTTPVCLERNAWIWVFIRGHGNNWYVRWTRDDGPKRLHWWLLSLLIGRRLAWEVEFFFWCRETND